MMILVTLPTSRSRASHSPHLSKAARLKRKLALKPPSLLVVSLLHLNRGPLSTSCKILKFYGPLTMAKCSLTMRLRRLLRQFLARMLVVVSTRSQDLVCTTHLFQAKKATTSLFATKKPLLLRCRVFPISLSLLYRISRLNALLRNITSRVLNGTI